MKKILAVVCVVAMMLSLSIVAGAEEKKAITITTAEELAGMANDLTADYILDADIDLAGITWNPIGTYKPSGESEEEQEIPASDAAFTGTFDGQGHTIRNLTITGEDGIAVGLFGCIANTEVGNFTLENASTEGTIMVADAVGYSFTSTVHDVHLVNGKVTAYAGEMSAEGMYGGIVGAGMASRIVDCSADAEITIPDGTANAGIVGGGLELTSLVNCTATGSVTAGANCYGLGGVSGCGFGAEEFTYCKASDVTITAGAGCYWIGSITGYAGGYEAQEYGTPVTVFTDCSAENVNIVQTCGEEDLVGAGFYNEAVAQAHGAPFDQPTVYVIRDSAAEEVNEGTAAAAEKLLEDVSGTYDALFPVITSPDYDQIWLDSCAAVLGDEAAPAAAEALKAACNGTIYGQEAIDVYGDGSNGAQFDCLFINGPAQIVFEGKKISGLDETGATVFSHEYSFVEPASIAGMMNGYLYRTEDADAGEFEYFFLLPDTPDTTFHTEFRYGSDPEALMLYNDGPYAYWLAAGIPADRDEQMVQNVIDLFCTENLAEMSEEAAA
ncbi:MAG: hypothetical protein IIY90_03540 [Oscillospiraceae bacterium]|nr:hypothetical protein [Oscillospiraceae bacterium]